MASYYGFFLENMSPALLIVGALLAYALVSFAEHFVHGYVMHSALDPSHLDHHLAVNLDMTLQHEKGTFFRAPFAVAIFTMSCAVFLGVIRLLRALDALLRPAAQYRLAAALVALATLAATAFAEFEASGRYRLAPRGRWFEQAGYGLSAFLALYARLT